MTLPLKQLKNRKKKTPKDNPIENKKLLKPTLQARTLRTLGLMSKPDFQCLSKGQQEWAKSNFWGKNVPEDQFWGRQALFLPLAAGTLWGQGQSIPCLPALTGWVDITRMKGCQM